MMRHRDRYGPTLACVLATGWCLLSAASVRADDIVTIQDQHGHRIYVNAGGTKRGAIDLRPQSFMAKDPSIPPGTPPDVARLVQDTANRHRIDPDLVHAIIKVESCYNPNAISRKGAMGLMQLIPATAHRFGVQDIFDPKQNIEGGVTYLRYLLDMFGGNLPLSLAAYNAGEHSVLRYGGVPSFQETRAYVRRVTSLYGLDPLTGTKRNEADSANPPIHRYVDATGVIHFSNVD